MSARELDPGIAGLNIGRNGEKEILCFSSGFFPASSFRERNASFMLQKIKAESPRQKNSKTCFPSPAAKCQIGTKKSRFSVSASLSLLFFIVKMSCGSSRPGDFRAIWIKGLKTSDEKRTAFRGEQKRPIGNAVRTPERKRIQEPLMQKLIYDLATKEDAMLDAQFIIR